MGIDYDFWLMFIGVSIALNAAPGPDVLYIVTKTISSGKKIGFASSLGVCTGAVFHIFLASMGLSAILLTSAIAFTIVKYIGVFYLLYLAYQSFKSNGENFNIEKKHHKDTFYNAFKQGVLIDILNPKVALFFMAFLPQFLREGYGSVPFQFAYLGFVVILFAIIIEGIYILSADKISSKFRQNRRYSIYLNRVVGTVFLALGIKLATSSNT
jgi:threonine/homoserine/homoserine lactone efflux protein